jgi:hypothetical protein
MKEKANKREEGPTLSKTERVGHPRVSSAARVRQPRRSEISGAGDGNRTNPNEPNKGVTTRSTVQLESNGVKYAKSYHPVRGRQLNVAQKFKTRTLENHEDAAPKF